MGVRHHLRRTDDGKGFRRLIAGRRWRSPAGLSKSEAERRFFRIEQVWQDSEAFCQRIGVTLHWTDVAIWAAEQIRKGELRIPLPPLDDIMTDYGDVDLPARLWIIADRYTDDTLACHLPKTVEGLTYDEAYHVYEVVSETYPSVGWILPELHRQQVENRHERQARYSLERLAEAKGEALPDTSTPLVAGTLHEVLGAYEQVRNDQKKPGMAKLVRAVKECSPDLPLASLDFTACQLLLDIWRTRPFSEKTGTVMGKKTCENHIGETNRFFTWLHLTNRFGWRKSADHGELKTSVEERPSDFPSVTAPPIKRFSLSDLQSIYGVADKLDRLLLVWALNCAHGPAEFGRVEWGDLLLRQSHPWITDGLDYPADSNDSWIGFLRPKTKVLGWWLLWHETVLLLDWWRGEWENRMKRPPQPKDRVLVDTKGVPMYRDGKRNAQSVFTNRWSKLLDKVPNARRLPYGTLRNQLSDWLGGDQGKAVVASVALAHGIPHKDDRLLYRHYSNRPWRQLFESQRAYREHLALMFEEVSVARGR